MGDLPPGWATDLAICEHSGATVEERRDRLLVRTLPAKHFLQVPHTPREVVGRDSRIASSSTWVHWVERHQLKGGCAI